MLILIKYLNSFFFFSFDFIVKICLQRYVYSLYEEKKNHKMGLFFLGIQTPFYSTSTKAPTYMIHFQVFFTVTKVRFTWSQDLVLSHVYLSFVFDLVATQSKSLFPSFGLWCFLSHFPSQFSHLVFKEKATKKIFLFPDLLNHLRPKLNL